MRKHSQQMEKYQKYISTKEVTSGTMDLQRQVSQSFQTVTDNLREMVLREKISAHNHEITHFRKKNSFEHQSVPLKYHLRQKKRLYDK
jgi:hypothetical protein